MRGDAWPTGVSSRRRRTRGHWRPTSGRRSWRRPRWCAGPAPRGKQVITGAAVITLQALEQFVLYTGVRSSDDQVRRASEFARA